MPFWQKIKASSIYEGEIAITAAITHLHSLTREHSNENTTGIIEESSAVAATAQEQSTIIDEMVNNLHGLARLAESLKQEVSKFKVD